jgi:acetamidase/formamidase
VVGSPVQPGTGRIRGTYVPSTPETVRWGRLPTAGATPVTTVSSGTVVTFDTVSHEGIVEDQGRDPIEYFGQYGVSEAGILDDAKAIAYSDIDRTFGIDGPHVVTGPVAVRGAQPGDTLKVETLSAVPRVNYGVISNRHGLGGLPGEFPENDGPQDGASQDNPELYNNVSLFTPVKRIQGRAHGVIPVGDGGEARFALAPFLGIMGVAMDLDEEPSSVPPTKAGGNMDIRDLTAGSALYLPVFAPGGLFFVGDPHMAQGQGEVALTALEGSLRAEVRLTLLKQGDPSIPGSGLLEQPFAETDEWWISVGLDPSLDEAMKQAIREAVQFLDDELGMERAAALAYLSAAGDFVVTQVVNQTKGVHCQIRKPDFVSYSR